MFSVCEKNQRPNAMEKGCDNKQITEEKGENILLLRLLMSMEKNHFNDV